MTGDSTERETIGREWTGAELTVVVGDYLTQLEKTLAGKPVDRATHDRAVRFVTGKSGMPVMAKQGEITAVLSLIGLPVLKDPPPRWTYDAPLLTAIEDALLAKPALLAAAVRPDALFAAPPAIPLIEAAPPSPCRRTRPWLGSSSASTWPRAPPRIASCLAWARPASSPTRSAA